ncbi:MAG: hypothetical protein NWE96_09755 [Candidatus Bathyarchaeota archaeon]|nr:hypothetical protein [Candidatus Bathyarchaeota archaeon]
MDKEDSVQKLVFVRYVDHVLYHRTSALAVQPQIREAVGWLVYECDQYVTICWDRDTQPPSLRGSDPKASGLVLLKSDIIELVKQDELILKSQDNKQEDEFALKPKERKTRRPRKTEAET